MFKAAKLKAWKLNGPVNSQEATMAHQQQKTQASPLCGYMMGPYFLHRMAVAQTPCLCLVIQTLRLQSNYKAPKAELD